jgi:2-polyprenyl-3-methyl-5-hydroxy-6-metoxy-1,4-benzoquinol methylase
METFMYRDFDRLEDQHWWFAGRRQVVAAFLETRLGASRGLKILDVGCGTGGMLPMLARWGQVSAFDPVDEAVQAAMARAPAGARVWKGEIPDAVPADHSFDLVTAFDVLEHLDDPVGAVARIKAALAPRGLFVATVPAYQFLWSHHDEVNQHRRRYTVQMLAEHLEAGGLRVDKATHFNSALFPPIAAVRLLQKVLPSKAGKASDTQDTPPLVNGVLKQLFAAERLIVGRAPMPFGVSIIAAASAA